MSLFCLCNGSVRDRITSHQKIKRLKVNVTNNTTIIELRAGECIQSVAWDMVHNNTFIYLHDLIIIWDVIKQNESEVVSDMLLVSQVLFP